MVPVVTPYLHCAAAARFQHIGERLQVRRVANQIRTTTAQSFPMNVLVLTGIVGYVSLGGMATFIVCRDMWHGSDRTGVDFASIILLAPLAWAVWPIVGLTILVVHGPDYINVNWTRVGDRMFGSASNKHKRHTLLASYDWDALNKQVDVVRPPKASPEELPKSLATNLLACSRRACTMTGESNNAFHLRKEDPHAVGTHHTSNSYDCFTG